MATTNTEKPVPSPFSGANYSKNEGKCGNDAAPCVICGKPVKNSSPAKSAEVTDGGNRFVPIAEKADENDDGYMGFYPVGSECARLFPAGYLHNPK